MSNTEALVAEDAAMEEPFSARQIEGATFRVDWQNVRKVAKHGRGGGDYVTPCLLTDIKGYVVPIWVEFTRNDYDALRLLKMQGIKAYSCTLGQPKTPTGFAPRLYAGAKDW